MSGTLAGPWYRTGEYRIVPSWFGFMRAEQQERRDYRWPGDEEVVGFNLRWVPYSPSFQEARDLSENFLSIMTGDSVLKRFITWWRHD